MAASEVNDRDVEHYKPTVDLDSGANVGSPQLGRKVRTEIDSHEESGTPLNTSWTFWVDKSIRGTSAAEYEAMLRKLYTVSTAEGFWSVYNNVPDPSKLNVRYSYHLMRHERRPMWEDVCHCRGGHWTMKIKKCDVSEVWKELLVALIGEQLTNHIAEGDEISGVSISIREREDIIQIWNTNASLSDKASVIEKVKDLLPKVRFSAVFYKAFEAHDAFEASKAQGAHA